MLVHHSVKKHTILTWAVSKFYYVLAMFQEIMEYLVLKTLHTVNSKICVLLSNVRKIVLIFIVSKFVVI